MGAAVSLLASFVLNNLSLILSLFGGSGDVSGVISSIGGIYMGGGSAVSVVPAWLVALALVFSTVIGLAAGILPANRAVKISALEAIRHE